MRADIHPKYEKLVATCSCGNVIETRSALAKDTLYLDVCSACHPFYTGKQKNVDTGGRIDKFNTKMAAAKAVVKSDKTRAKKGKNKQSLADMMKEDAAAKPAPTPKKKVAKDEVEAKTPEAVEAPVEVATESAAE